jgi:hypothetical protein
VSPPWLRTSLPDDTAQEILRDNRSFGRQGPFSILSGHGEWLSGRPGAVESRAIFGWEEAGSVESRTVKWVLDRPGFVQEFASCCVRQMLPAPGQFDSHAQARRLPATQVGMRLLALASQSAGAEAIGTEQVYGGPQGCGEYEEGCVAEADATPLCPILCPHPSWKRYPWLLARHLDNALCP